MVAVAKDKRSQNQGRPRKHSGDTDRQGRTGIPLSIRIDPDLRDAVPKFIADFKEKHDVQLGLTDVVEMALRRLFREAGIAIPPTGAKSDLG